MLFYIYRTVENACSSYQHPVVELLYDCVIKEPSFLTQEVGNPLYSPVFFSKANDKIRWRLIINPKGEHDEYFGLYLERIVVDAENDPPVVVKMKFTVWKNERQIFSHSNGAQLEMGNKPLPRCWGWSKLIKLDAIKRDLHRGAGTDKIKIRCQLIYTI